jgi:hypothetical protein
VAQYFYVEIGMNFNSIAMQKLFSRIDRIGMRSRTAVSKSMPINPIAASPHTLMQSLPGWDILHPFPSRDHNRVAGSCPCDHRQLLCVC